MSRKIQVGAIAGLVLVAATSLSHADCASECSAAYRSCRGNPDSCLSAQGVCLSRCGAARERHGAIAFSSKTASYGYSYDFDSAREASSAAVGNCRKEDAAADDCKVVVTFHDACGALALGDRGAYGSAWGLSRREAAAKALGECRPFGGASCKVESQVCTGAGR